MMKAIRFSAEGMLNSFRIPFFRTYHRSFLAPPKTTVIGMLTNILGEPEKWYYETLNKDEVKVSVVINDIMGKAKDLWAYKTFESKSGMHGRSIFRRDKLYLACYTIYLTTANDELRSRLGKGLKSPASIPALGLDDEMVRIFDVQEIELTENSTGRVDSVFMDYEYKYRAFIKDGARPVEFPLSNFTPLNYEIALTTDGVRSKRIARNEAKQVDFINCEVELEGVKSYTDGVNRVVFY